MNKPCMSRLRSLHPQRIAQLASILIVSSMISRAIAVQPADVIYSNLSGSRLGVSFPNVDQIMWDDINPIHGGRLSEIKLDVQNQATTPSTRFRGMIELRLFDNPVGGPLGTLL